MGRRTSLAVSLNLTKYPNQPIIGPTAGSFSKTEDSLSRRWEESTWPILSGLAAHVPEAGIHYRRKFDPEILETQHNS